MCGTGWKGEFCERKDCPTDCNQNGVCVDGVCECLPEWYGPECAVLLSDVPCPFNCSGNGCCRTVGAGVERCICHAGWTGRYCQSEPVPECPDNCSDVGDCVNGTCYCPPGFAGDACDRRECEPPCWNGRCGTDGMCDCYFGWRGSTCEERECPNGCKPHGHCDNGTCVCKPGYRGTSCALTTCTPECVNGLCDEVRLMCNCEQGWIGVACNITVSEARGGCANNCTGRGACVNSMCVCDAGWRGSMCEIQTCGAACSKNGRCFEDKCYCAKGWTGTDCEVPR